MAVNNSNSRWRVNEVKQRLKCSSPGLAAGGGREGAVAAFLNLSPHSVAAVKWNIGTEGTSLLSSPPRNKTSHGGVSNTSGLR